MILHYNVAGKTTKGKYVLLNLTADNFLIHAAPNRRSTAYTEEEAFEMMKRFNEVVQSRYKTYLEWAAEQPRGSDWEKMYLEDAEFYRNIDLKLVTVSIPD